MVSVVSRSKSIKAHEYTGTSYAALVAQVAKDSKLSSNRLRFTTEDKKVITSTEQLLQETTVIVKDLGPQIGWRTVYIIEYLGPLLIHLLAYHLAGSPHQYSLLYKMQVFHYVKREVENVFVHRFSSSTMPLFNLFKNSGYYWFVGASLANMYFTELLNFDIPGWVPEKYMSYLFYAWCMCQYFNALTHVQLRLLGDKSIRQNKPRVPPAGGLFELFISPNYTFEIYGWFIVFLMRPNACSLLFVTVGAAQMYVWAQQKNKRYGTKRAFLVPYVL